MSISIRGTSNNLANVDANNNLTVNTPTIMSGAGYVSMVTTIDEGNFIGSKTVRSLDVSLQGRTRIGSDSLWWDDTFNHTVFNSSVYQGVTSTMTMTLGGGFLNINAGNSVTSTNVARLQTYRTFSVFGTYPVYFECWLKFSNTFQTNVVQEFGLGYATSTSTPTDAVIFRVEGTILKGLINNNGSEISTGNITLLTPVIGTIYHFMIIINNDRTEFWINGELKGFINTPAGLSSPMLSPSLPLLIRQYNNGTAGGVIQMNVGRITISQGDLVSNRLWSTTMVGNGQSSISAPHGSTAGQTANYNNSQAPATATLSNTAASYTTLGGQWQFAAPLANETDYALFAYQVPFGSAGNPGKNLIIRGVRIDAYNTGAIVAGTATLLQWGLGIGSTGVSLLTADSTTSGTRAARRITIGTQTFLVGSAIGAVASTVDVNFDTPLIVEPGTYFHIILKVPIGTATALQVIRGTCFVNAYFE